MTTQIDNSLIEKYLADGHTDKDFEEIYTHYYKYVYYRSFSLIKDASLAEDLTQDTFCKVYQNLHLLEHSESFITWINRINYSVFCNGYNKKIKQSEVDLGDKFDFNLVRSEDEEPSEASKNTELANIISSAIVKLPSKQQIVARLYYYDEMSVQEISDVLNIPIGTVKSRLSVLRAKLKKILKSSKVSPSLYFSFTPLVMHQAFEQIQRQISVPSIPPVNEVITQANIKIPVTESANIIPYFTVAGVVVSMLGGGYLLNIYGGGEEPAITSLKTPDTPICGEAPISIVFDDSEQIKSVVLVSEDGNKLSFDKNDTEYEIVIDKNSNYRIIALLDNGKELTHDLAITSFDCKSPEISKVDYDEESAVFLIEVTDDNTGISIENSYLESNGTQYMGTYDQATSIFTIPMDLSTKSLLHIEDLAGNWSNLEIDFSNN